MPELSTPDTRFHASFLEAMKEFAAEGRGVPEDGSNVGRDLRGWGSRWEDPAVFAAYAAGLREEADHAVPPRPGWVHCTQLWVVDADTDTYYGRIAVRHELNEFLRDIGGHIGYDIRPTARRRGYATAALRAVLPVARELGLRSVLVTCDTGNVASRKVIETCGGVFEDQRHGKLRYWVDTGAGHGAGEAREGGG
ncbi:GNAT family N-acetyltransferase [Streptomyces boninensis]|uniref:GNAT family N-acetyltransferase n=1 Tax=Streptomyces boninensis TaxID=2039455 RepID=UPI003B20C8E4